MEWIIKNPFFLQISDTHSVRGYWGQLVQLLWKLNDDETQMGNHCDHAARDLSSKLSIFLPLALTLGDEADLNEK